MQRNAPGLVQQYESKDCSPAGLHSLFNPETEGIHGCSSALHMLFFSPASQNKCLGTEQGAACPLGMPGQASGSPALRKLCCCCTGDACSKLANCFKLPARTNFWMLTGLSEAQSSVKAETPSLTPVPQA